MYHELRSSIVIFLRMLVGANIETGVFGTKRTRVVCCRGSNHFTNNYINYRPTQTATHGIIFVANKPKTQMKSHCLASALLLLFGAVPGAFSADEVS